MPYKTSKILATCLFDLQKLRSIINLNYLKKPTIFKVLLINLKSLREIEN